MRALLLTCFALTAGCSTSGWNPGVPASPLLGVDESGIWRFPTPQPPPSADLTPELAPSAAPSASTEPAKSRSRKPKPFARPATSAPWAM